MKIVYAAVFSSGSTNVSQARAFRRQGVDLIEYNYRFMAKELGSDIQRDEDLIRLLMAERPSVLLLSKCNEMSNRVISESQKMGVKCFLWFMDPLFTFESLPEMTPRVKMCDHSFFNIRETYEHAKGLSDKCSFLQEGFDADVDFPRDLPKTRDVVFIGNLRGDRGSHQKATGFEVVTDAYGERHAEVVSETKVNLNFTDGGASDRVYKVLAAGGFLLTEPWPEMERDFKIGVDLDVFRGHAELKEKIDYYLAHEDIRELIAENGLQAVQRFSRDEWTRRIIERI